jgi:DNA polymerase III psi subunit
VVGASCIDMHPARKPPPVMVLTVSKTRISVALQRARKSSFAWRVRCVSCVRTKLHMSGYLFVHTCMHVRQRTSYDLPYEREGVLHRHVQEARWVTPVQATCACPWKKIFSCVRAQETQRNHRTKALLWTSIHAQRDCGFEHAEKHDGLGRA